MRVAGRELDEWLLDFTEKIRDKVKNDRIDEEIIDGIYEDDRLPNYIWRIHEERSERFVSIIPKTEVVTPFTIRVSGSIDQWVADPQSFAIDFLLNEIARLVIIREAITTLHCLLSEAKEFTSTEGRLTKKDIKKAVE
jgi:hypothetical protein